MTPETNVVVITGASAGVGRATARKFAKRGASVGLLARGEAALEAAQNEIEELADRDRELSMVGKHASSFAIGHRSRCRYGAICANKANTG